MFTTYEKYLEYLNNFFAKCFEMQKEYICCKKGCSMCCEHGTYPMSEIEYKYLKYGFSLLDENLQKEILSNIEKLLKAKSKCKENMFMHACPFLLNKSCSLYNHRALICRSFGLLSYETTGNETKYKAPCCIDKGLNYSQVYDAKNDMVDFRLAKEGMPEPNAFNIGLKILKNNKNCTDVNFGEMKTLLDWIETLKLT